MTFHSASHYVGWRAFAALFHASLRLLCRILGAYIRIEDFNGGGWLVGPDLGDPTAFLRNISKSAAVPTSGWQYWQYSYGGGCWWPAPADLTATLLPDLSTILCANVTVSAYLLSFSPQPGYSGAAARCSRPPPAGCYRPVIVAAGSCAMVRVRRGCW